MKTNPFATLTAAIAAVLTSPASAIEAPADNAPPPAEQAPPAGQAPAEQAPKPEAGPKTAYLGVVSSELPDMLREHLGFEARRWHCC